MDIVTHVMMGAAATSPFWETHPLPFDRERRYLEWVFFIDATVIALTTGALAIQGRLLRTRHFGTDFGRLTVELSGSEPRVERFDA